MKKIIKPIFFVSSLVALSTSCSEDLMDDINRDRNNANDVSAKMILADAITSSAFNQVGGDLNAYTSIYVEHEAGVHGQFNQAETREGLTVPSLLNNSWANIYNNIKNIRIALEKCSDGGSQAGNYPTKGIAEVLLALNSAILADGWGNAPYTEAAVYKDGKLVYMNPKIDTQESIYKEVMRLLDAAIEDLAKADASGTGSMQSYDFLYGGNVAKWTKLAYGLKARYTMQLLNRSTNKNADLAKVIEYADKSFTSASEQAAFNIYNSSNLNPFFGIAWARQGFAASKSLADKLIARNDPRLKRVFVDKDRKRVESNTSANYLVFENGKKAQEQGVYNTSIFVYSQTASTMLMSYHEVLFLKAEAQARLGNIADAQVTLKNAVVAAIANAELSVEAALKAPTVMNDASIKETTNPITTAEAQNYFDTNVLPLFTANSLKEVMVQKYLGTFGASGESPIAYNDIRRLRALGEGSLIELTNSNPFPLRHIYGASDTTTNPNVKQATGDGNYIYTENVWWAGGTR